MKLELFAPAEVYSHLKKGLSHLQKVGCKAIIMPCNTIHCFHSELQKNSKLKILSLIDLAVDKVSKSQHKNIAIISSETTFKLGLYKNELLNLGLNPILVTSTQQKILNRIILKVMSGSSSQTELLQLLKIIETLKSKGATALVLACTELPLVLTPEHHAKTNLQVFDTIQISAHALVDFAYSKLQVNDK